IRANAKRQLAATMEALKQLDRLGHCQPVAEDQHLAQRVDLVGLVMRNQALAPVKGVTAVMARTIKELAEIQIEVTQEGAHAVHVRQRNAQVTTILTCPGLKAKDLAVAQARAQRLAGLQVFMRQRT